MLVIRFIISHVNRLIGKALLVLQVKNDLVVAAILLNAFILEIPFLSSQLLKRQIVNGLDPYLRSQIHFIGIPNLLVNSI